MRGEGGRGTDSYVRTYYYIYLSAALPHTSHQCMSYPEEPSTVAKCRISRSRARSQSVLHRSFPARRFGFFSVEIWCSGTFPTRSHLLPSALAPGMFDESRRRCGLDSRLLALLTPNRQPSLHLQQVPWWVSDVVLQRETGNQASSASIGRCYRVRSGL